MIKDFCTKKLHCIILKMEKQRKERQENISKNIEIDK